MNGLSAEEQMRGLKERDSEWFWETPENLVPNGIDAWSLRTTALELESSASIPPTSEPVLSESIAQDPSPKPSTPAEETQIHTSNSTTENSSENQSNSRTISASSNGSHVIPGTPDHTQTDQNLTPFQSQREYSGPLPLSGTPDSYAPSKIIPQKRSGSPLQKEASANVICSQSTPVTIKTSAQNTLVKKRSRGKSGSVQPRITDRLRTIRMPQSSVQKDAAVPITQPTAAMPSITPGVAPATSSSSSQPPLDAIAATTPIPPSPLSYYTIPFVPMSAGPSVPPSTLNPDPVTNLSYYHQMPPHTSSLRAPASIAPTGNPPLEPIIQAFDTIFAGFSESLRRFSNEIQQAKIDGVSQIRDSLSQALAGGIEGIGTGPSSSSTSTSTHPTALMGDMIRDIVRSEVQRTVHEDLSREWKAMKKEIVKEMTGSKGWS